MIPLVQAVMTAATLCFAAGYVQRHRNNALHRKLMALGFFLTVSIAVVLVAGVHGFGATYGPASWLLAAVGEDSASAVLITHRGIATLTFLALSAQVITGWRRHPLHRRLHRVVVPLWIATYASGMVIFQ